MKETRIFECAKHTAEMSHFWRQKVGCVVVYKRRIISSGFNSDKTHPMQKEYNKFRYSEDNTPHTIHAEMHALMPLRYADVDWSKVQLYIYRLKKDEPTNSGYARPCPACMAYIKSLGIKEIYYTTSTTPVHEILDL